jgi:hypothetical protein
VNRYLVHELLKKKQHDFFVLGDAGICDWIFVWSVVVGVLLVSGLNSKQLY